MLRPPGMKLRAKIMGQTHRAAHGLLKAAGFAFETRQSGELILGLWRKKIRSGKAGKTPRRFVLIPGFGDSPLSWLGVISLLSPVLRNYYDEWVLVDFPGFPGYLARERPFPSMDLLMDKLFDVFDSLKPDTIFGHSLGGWLGARYSADCGAGLRPITVLPQKTSPSEDLPRETLGRSKGYTGPRLLLLANPSGICGDESLRKAWASRMEKVIESGGFQLLRPHIFGKEPFWFRYFFPEFGSLTMHEDTLQFMKSVREEHLLEEKAAQIRAQVRLVWGEIDTMTPSAFSKGWLTCLPRESEAQAILLKGIGHCPHIESPALTALILGGILANKKTELLSHPWAQRWCTVARP